ncbi:MAG: sensor histidine kinase KdpD [Thermoleophilia bacterium]|nr:sensor histidine kinase KdpD [Thermoleophilia bacterium]
MDTPRTSGRGHLVVYLGAAAGVGKTYAMLGEARLAAGEGVDLVVGYLEPHGRRATEDRARGLERAPVMSPGPGGRAGTEPDVPWILGRRPSVVLIDELAHAYATGEPPRRRHQDVRELLDHGIDVWTTLNVQHLEGLGPRVRRLTGVEVRETVPDHLVHAADEIRLVDLAPDALRERIARGLVYPGDRIPQALDGFFTVANLTALRALVLHELAEVAAARFAAVTGEHLPTQAQRVLAALDGRPGDAAVLREAGRVGRRVGGDLLVLLVDTGGGGPAARRRLEDLAALAETLGATVLRRREDDAAAATAGEAVVQAATRIVLPRPRVEGMGGLLALRPLARLLRAVPGVTVELVEVREAPDTRPPGG